GAPADAAVVEDDRAVLLRELGHLEEPSHRIGGEPHDAEERNPAAVLLVVELDVAHLRGRHSERAIRWGGLRASALRSDVAGRAPGQRAACGSPLGWPWGCDGAC